MSETVKWSELTSEERDALIAEKVMGWKPTVCDATAEDILVTPDGMRFYCLRCQFQSGVARRKDGRLYWMHTQPVPHFSTSLDAAWKVVQKMNESIGDGFDRYAAFIDHMEKIVGSDMFFDLFYCDQHECHLNPQRLCIAALRACGVEVIAE